MKQGCKKGIFSCGQSLNKLFCSFFAFIRQESQIRITPPPPYNHPNSQENPIISNSNLMQSSKPNADNSQGQNINNLPSISSNINISSNSGSSTNNRRNINRAGNSSLTVKNAVMRYNRRNNPELEKRRIHHCDFLGESLK